VFGGSVLISDTRTIASNPSPASVDGSMGALGLTSVVRATETGMIAIGPP
jgi:hypothetical protein